MATDATVRIDRTTRLAASTLHGVVTDYVTRLARRDTTARVSGIAYSVLEGPAGAVIQLAIGRESLSGAPRFSRWTLTPTGARHLAARLVEYADRAEGRT